MWIDGTNFIFVNNFSTFQIRIGAPIYYADISSITVNDGIECVIEFRQPASGQEVGIYINDQFYTNGTIASGYIPQSLKTFSGDSDGDYQIWDIEYFSIDPETEEMTTLALFAVDDFLNDGDVASATIGAGTITYNVAS